MIDLQGQLINKVIKKFGEEKFNEIILKIYSSKEISELNFDQKEIDEVILPLSQLGLINVENAYFRERPIEHKTRYNLFSFSDKGKIIVESILEKFNLPKRVDVFISKYPLKILAFVAYFLVSGNRYLAYLEEGYHKLLEKAEFTNFIKEFKQDVKEYSCGFLIKEFSSKRAEEYPPTLFVLPEFLSCLRTQLPMEVVERELKEFKLIQYIENYFLKPPTKAEWLKEFLKKVEEEKLQNIWEDWSKKLASENLLIEHVVLDPNGLKKFLTQEIERIQNQFVVRTKMEENVKEFLKTLETMRIQLNDEDKNDILGSCETRKDFSTFISAVYKILHDRMDIKDEKIDAIRCYFHHDKSDKQQEWYRRNFDEFCKDNLVNFPPRDDEWKILKEKILERATKKTRNMKSLRTASGKLADIHDFSRHETSASL